MGQRISAWNKEIKMFHLPQNASGFMLVNWKSWVGEDQVASATEQAWAANPMLYLRAESHEITSTYPRSRTLRQILCLGYTFVGIRATGNTCNTILDVKQVAVGECTDRRDHGDISWTRTSTQLQIIDRGAEGGDHILDLYPFDGHD